MGNGFGKRERGYRGEKEIKKVAKGRNVDKEAGEKQFEEHCAAVHYNLKP